MRSECISIGEEVIIGKDVDDFSKKNSSGEGNHLMILQSQSVGELFPCRKCMMSFVDVVC